MIKTGGLNVYSQEVEHALLKHPAVREAGVIGLPREKWGEEVTVVVVLRDGHAATDADLRDFCRRTLAGYGKILKRELRARLGR